MQPSKVVFVVALTFVAALGAACDHEPRQSGDGARERWSDVQPQARARVAELRSKQTVLAGRIGALAVPPGVNAPDLTARFAALQGRVGMLETPLGALETETAEVTAEVEAAFAVKDRPRARRAVEAAETRLAASAARAEAAFADVERLVPDAEAELQRVQSALTTEQGRFANLAAIGGTLDLPTVKFREPTGSELALDDVESKAALDRLVQMTGACKQLRVTLLVTLSVHPTRPDAAAARALGLARAEAVRAYLVAAGVSPEILSMAPSPAPTQAMPDSVQVTVTTSCAPPSADQPVAPPAPIVPTAERAPAPGHEGHGH